MTPATKIPRFEFTAEKNSSPEEEFEKPDYSMPPTEILLDIFKYLQKK